MNLSVIKQTAEKLMIDRSAHAERERGSIFYHGERVANTAIILRKIILPDDTSHDDKLTVASWFHDIGKGIEPHAKYGAALTKVTLKDCCEPEEVSAIIELIEYHCNRSPKSNTYTEYVKLIQDADMIDHYGTFTIWMDIFYSAYKNKSIEQTAFYNETEWKEHCQGNRALLNYKISQEIFDEKIKFVNEFYSRLRIEGQGEIFNAGNT